MTPPAPSGLPMAYFIYWLPFRHHLWLAALTRAWQMHQKPVSIPATPPFTPI